MVKPKLEWADLDDVIRSAIDLVGDGLARHRVTIDVGDHLPLVKIDQGLIEQAIANLLLNAAAWSPADSEIAVRGALSAGRLQVTVSDQGSGIAPEDLGRIFDKFYRAARCPDRRNGLGALHC